jgi:hypothetical protein
MATAEMIDGGRPPDAGVKSSGRDRRAADRFDMNRAPGTLSNSGLRMTCEVIDLSLTGCCVETREIFKPGALAQVKLMVPIQGIILSIWGVTQWVRRDHLVGIQFIHPTGRSKNQLAGLLTCLLDKSASEVVKAALAAHAESMIVSLEHPPLAVPQAAQPEVPVSVEEEFQQLNPPLPRRPRPTLMDAHKIQDLDLENAPAVLRLVAADIQFGGHVLDLSSNGCIVRLLHPYRGSIMVRVEVDFQVKGLPFRLPGVTEAFHDDLTIEVRFLDVSPRKKEDLDQVIRELLEEADKKRAEEARREEINPDPA